MNAYDSPEKQAAYDALIKACAEYGKFCPPPPKPKEPPVIRPVLLHTAPESFGLGFNMYCESGGYMPGKIPVIVMPVRPEDIRKYKSKRTATFLLRHLGVNA